MRMQQKKHAINAKNVVVLNRATNAMQLRIGKQFNLDLQEERSLDEHRSNAFKNHFFSFVSSSVVIEIFESSATVLNQINTCNPRETDNGHDIWITKALHSGRESKLMPTENFLHEATDGTHKNCFETVRTRTLSSTWIPFAVTVGGSFSSIHVYCQSQSQWPNISPLLQNTTLLQNERAPVSTCNKVL